MQMKIDKRLLPLKYSLEVYKMVESYPSTMDLLFEVVQILEARSKLESTFKPSEMLREVSVRLGDTDLAEGFNVLVNEGWLSCENENYRLLTHPWMEKTI